MDADIAIPEEPKHLKWYPKRAVAFQEVYQSIRVLQAHSSNVTCLSNSKADSKRDHLFAGLVGTDGQDAFEGPVEEVVRAEAKEAKDSLEKLDIPSFVEKFTSWNILHLNTESTAWEGRAYDYCMENLKNMGFPVDGLAFHPELNMIESIGVREMKMLKEVMNVSFLRVVTVKEPLNTLLENMIESIGVREMKMLKEVMNVSFLRVVMVKELVDGSFSNTFFSMSEVVTYMQMVDKLDGGVIPSNLDSFDYKGLY
ncbi:hypothetical protein JHK85_024943 [Glycine max]|nr:hypothetical protein JHK85_024943 [Glycine max]KAG5012190.1 hypothetical protein JHK86_024451 [Glycine max]